MTGFRLAPQLGVIGKRLGKLKESTRADSFKPEMQRYVTATLRDCVTTTPVRNESLIARNQARQYRNRINYIPSFHTLENPSLIVNENGQEFIYYNDKWYRGDWRMPPEVFAAYSMLMEERNRRMQTAQSDFVNERKQARFLYRKSWYQIGQSLGLSIAAPGEVTASHSRKQPAKEPPKAYGQWRGGYRVLSVAIFNPFLDKKTAYWNGNGKQILAQAQAKNRPRFLKECQDKVKREISAARRSN